MVKLPSRFNPSKLSQDSSEFSLAIPVSQFKRLSAGLANSDGDVRAAMRFSMGARRRVSVSGKFNADVSVTCQRCLMAFSVPVAANFSLTFVATEAMIDELPEDLDPVLLDEQGRIHAVDLLEDEIILNVPVAPRHVELTDCIANGYVNEQYEFDESLVVQEQEVEQQPRKNPFQILKNLTEQD